MSTRHSFWRGHPLLARPAAGPFLSKVEIFKKAEPGAVALLSLLMHHMTLVPHTNVIVQGEMNDTLYFVRSGELKVFVANDDEGRKSALRPEWNEVASQMKDVIKEQVRARNGGRLMEMVERMRMQEIGADDDDDDDDVRAKGSPRGRVLQAAVSDVERVTRLAVSASAFLRRARHAVAERIHSGIPHHHQQQHAGGAHGAAAAEESGTRAAAEPAPAADDSFARAARRESVNVDARCKLRDSINSVVAVNKCVDRIHAERLEEEQVKRVTQLKEAGEHDDSGLGVAVGRLSDGMAFGEQSFLALVPSPSMATVRT